jgi:hypothetical protein
VCCLLTSLFLLGPRAAILVWWLIQPVRWQTVFHNMFLVPVLGFLLLPWTTLAYVFATPTGAIGSSTAWGIVLIGLIIDIIGYAGGGFGNRGRVSRYAG